MNSDTAEHTCDRCGETFDETNELSRHMNGHNTRIEPEAVRRELQRLADEHGRAPTVSMMTEHGAYSKQTVRARFGSWEAALQSAGLSPNAYHNVSAADVTAEISKVTEQLGHRPTAAEFEAHAKFAVDHAQREFGSWNDALRAAGYDTHHEYAISDEALLDAIRSLVDKLDKVPTASEMDDHGAYSCRCYFDRWDGWQAAVRAAGYEPVGYPTGPDNHRWKAQTAEGWRDYGPNWQTQREKALERDDHTCQTPGCDRTTESHREEFGMGLAVHHIRPLGTFGATRDEVDFKRANRLENLVTVCNPHHHLWERASPLRLDTRDFTQR